MACSHNPEPRVPKKNDVEPQAYRDAMARFAGAVHVVTTDGPGGKRGSTVIAACSVSDAPPMILVCINRENLKNEAFAVNRNFALNVLTPQHEPLAVAMSGLAGLPSEERFAVARWDTIATGAPALVDAMAVFDCEVFEAKDMASHRVLFGKVTGLRIGGQVEPLIYFDRAYRSL